MTDDFAPEPASEPERESDFLGADSPLDDAELDAVLEALLLVVDTPVTVDALATATDQASPACAASRSEGGKARSSANFCTCGPPSSLCTAVPVCTVHLMFSRD